MNQQPLPDDSLSARLQLRDREALETVLLEQDPFRGSLIAAGATTLNLARHVHAALEKEMTRDGASLEQLGRLSPFINQFLRLNRFGANMLQVHGSLDK